MTTAPERTEITVSDYEHPEWCDLTKCEPTAGIHVKAEGCHHSTGTMWGCQSDDAEFRVQLVLGDDYLSGENHGRILLKVQLENLASQTDTGQPCYADAWVDPDDARMLAAILNRYADMADRFNRVGTTYVASELPRRRS